VTVAAVGVGPAAAAAGTARLLALAEAAGRPYRAVVSAGIAGGFTGRAGIGAVVIATASVQADLGADSPAGFQPLAALGLGPHAAEVDPELRAVLRRELPGAVTGQVLTVATVTGTGTRAAALAAHHPEAVAEAMEGYGVGCAAAGARVPFAELRTVSNLVGPRDRSKWRLDEALRDLSVAAPALAALAAAAGATGAEATGAGAGATGAGAGDPPDNGAVPGG
jgi:futalosine hydrolase